SGSAWSVTCARRRPTRTPACSVTSPTRGPSTAPDGSANTEVVVDPGQGRPDARQVSGLLGVCMVGVALYCCVRFFRPMLQVAGHGRAIGGWHLLMVATMAGLVRA